MTILLLIVSLAAILFGANILTDGSANIALRFKVAPFLVGLTIIAVGTSTPELVIGVISAVKGNSEMAIGNVVGSNIFNIFVIIGICALIRPIELSSSNIRRDIPTLVAVSVLLLLLTATGSLGLTEKNEIFRWEGVVLLALFALFVWWNIRKGREHSATQGEEAATTDKLKPVWLTALMIIFGLALLVGGGELFVRSASALARMIGISESVIAITIVAAGTSMPELASSIVALVKGKEDMALGNVIGSNVANILLVLGASAVIRPLPLGNITHIDITMALLGAVLLFAAAFTFTRHRVDRWEGAIYVALYGAYVWWLLK